MSPSDKQTITALSYENFIIAVTVDLERPYASCICSEIVNINYHLYKFWINWYKFLIVFKDSYTNIFFFSKKTNSWDI